MYQAMVVEDSKPILRSIARQIESVDSRIRVVATATNGREALTRLRNAKVDILFSDIKMPVMSGLDLLSEVRSQNPNLRCVIISGYDDFEFARQAIQLGVDEYILKPVANDELKTVLGKIVASLDRGRKQVFQEELSRALKRGEAVWHAPNDALHSPYGICLLRFGVLRDGSLAPDLAGMRATFDRAGPCAESLFFVEARGHSELAVLADLDVLSDEEWRNRCSGVFESMSRQGRIARMACSSGHSDVLELPAHVASLSRCLDGNVSLDAPTMLWLDDAPADRSTGILRDELERFREEATLVAGTHSPDEFRLGVGTFTSSWRARNLSLIVVRKLLGLLIDAIDESANDPPRDTTAVVEALLERSTSYEALVDELCRFHSVAIQRKGETEPSSESIVHAAVELFRRNLGRSISMSEVAARLGFSLSYVHRVLRSALGKAPMEYYNEMKLEEAKRLLGQYPNRKVKEIARSLGFEDEHYFSRVFKNHVSLSPGEYRQQAKPGP